MATSASSCTPSGIGAPVYPPDNALQPTTGHVAVDRLGVDTPTLEPRCVDHKARRDFIQKRF